MVLISSSSSSSSSKAAAILPCGRCAKRNEFTSSSEEPPWSPSSVMPWSPKTKNSAFAYTSFSVFKSFIMFLISLSFCSNFFFISLVFAPYVWPTWSAPSMWPIHTSQSASSSSSSRVLLSLVFLLSTLVLLPFLFLMARACAFFHELRTPVSTVSVSFTFIEGNASKSAKYEE